MPDHSLRVGHKDRYSNPTIDAGAGILVRPMHRYHRSADGPGIPGVNLHRDELIGFLWWHRCIANSSWVEVHFPADPVPCPVCGKHPPDLSKVSFE